MHQTATLTEILILAIIQGVTEWLPISSSGHLVIAQKYMGLRLTVFFDVVLHVGSLLVVLLTLRHTIFEVLRAVARLDFKSEEGRLAIYILIGSIPTAVIGFFFKDLFESFFCNLLVVGFALIATGAILFVSERTRGRERQLDHVDAILVGIAQGVALIPGISRSGVTIAAAFRRKVYRQAAFTFSFLLFIPATLAATILTGLEAGTLSSANIDYANMFLGLLVTIVVGYVCLRLVEKIVLAERFHLFAYYCWIIGFVVLLMQAM